MSGFANLSTREMRQILKERANLERQQKEAAAKVQREAYASVGADLFNAVVQAEEYTDRDTSEWAGFSARGIPFETEAGTFTMSVTITHVERVEEKKAALTAEVQALLAAEAAAKVAQA